MRRAPYYTDSTGSVTIYHGNCLDVLPTLSGLTAVVTDAPYGLGFMGKAWDHGVPGVEFWQAAALACLPGAHLLAFGGTRTFHRLACAIEDAGWEIRDCLSWLYGQGFPKSLDVSKAIDKAAGVEREVVGRRTDRAATPKQDMRGGRFLGGESGGIDCSAITAPSTDAAREWSGYGTALKPAWEPIILARKPLVGTVAQNAIEHGVGGLNVDGCRIATSAADAKAMDRCNTPGSGRFKVDEWAGGGWPAKRDPLDTSQGRWPANVVLDEEAATQIDAHSGERGSFLPADADYAAGTNRNVYSNETPHRTFSYGDTGGASRFFYTAKADRESFNTHPTVKPTDLMRWLVRMVAMPSRNLICDPFMGSGSTLVAARDEHVTCVGIEQDEASCEIAAKRLAQEVFPFDRGGIVSDEVARTAMI